MLRVYDMMGYLHDCNSPTFLDESTKPSNILQSENAKEGNISVRPASTFLSWLVYRQIVSDAAVCMSAESQ